MQFPFSRHSLDLRRLARSKLLWSLGAALILYTVVGFVLAPYLVERYVPSFAEEKLGRRASVEKVRINPYALTFEATGFRLEDKGDKPLLAFTRLFVNLQLWSMFTLAWRFDEVSLEGAELGLEIDRQARLNLLEVFQRLLKAPKPDEPPTRLVVGYLAIKDSIVRLTDLSGELPADATIAPINLELLNLSTLPDSEGRHTLQATGADGGTLTWKGVVSLQPIASAGEISIQGMKLESLWRFRRRGSNLARPGGDLSMAAHYEFHYEAGHGTLLLNRMQAEASNIRLALPEDTEPLLSLRSVKMSDAGFAFPKGEITLGKLVLADGVVNAIVAETGVMNWQRIHAPESAQSADPVVTAPAPQEPAPAGSAEPAGASRQSAPGAVQPWRIQLREVGVENIAVNYVDQTRKPALAVRTAALNAGLNADIASGEGPARILIDGINLALKALEVTTPGSSAPFASLDSLELAGGRVDSRERSMQAKLIQLARGDVKLAVGPTGAQGLLQSLAAPAPTTTAPQNLPSSTNASPAPTQTAQSDSAAPWRMQVDKVGIEKIALQFDDQSRKPGFGVRAEELNVDFTFDATAGGTEPRMVAKDLQIAIDRIRLGSQGVDAPLATLDSFRLTSGHVDAAERTVAAKTIALSGGGVRVVRGTDGAIGLMQAFASDKPETPAGAVRSAQPAASAGWRYRAEAIDLKRFNVALADNTYQPAIAYDAEITSVTANNVDAASKKPIAFTAALRVGKEGAANGRGTLQQDFSGAAAQLDLARVPLEPLRPLLAKFVKLDLMSGQLSAKTRVAYRSAGKPGLALRGQLSVDDVLVNEEGTSERFISWKTISADGMQLSMSPEKLVIKELRVNEPGAKLVIAADRTANLGKIVRKDDGSTAKSAPQAKPSSSDEPGFSYDIETIRVDNGKLDFSDLSLVLPFATHVQKLQGSIVGLSSDAQTKAQLKLVGQIDEYGEARADGALLPRDPAKFLDITARFDNVEMGPLSSYSATFAGRKIASGKLALVLEYKVVNSQLAGENRVVMRDFKLGERVEAPNAVNLPLDLAVALLRDSDGRINLDVPVRGNLGDPQFDYSKVIWAAIVNVLTRIVTAPFRLLGALFGNRDPDEMRTVNFTPGSDLLKPSQREELDALAKALKSRPQLRLVVKGPYDPEEDAKQLRRKEARLELARALDQKIQPGEEPGPIAFDRANVQRALEKLLAERAGPKAITDLEKSFAARAGREPDRVNPVLGLIGRGSKDTEFYEAVYERLSQAMPLSDTSVQQLAASRAQAIIDAFAKSGIDKQRVASGGITQVKADSERGVTTELALEAMPGS